MVDILMTAPMVLASLADIKTMTRRVVKPQPGNDPERHQPIKPYTNGRGAWNWVLEATGHGTGDPFPCPYGRPGDRIRVRETFYAWGRWETRFSAKKGRDEWHFVDMTLECGKAYVYAANGQPDGYTRQKRGGVTPAWWKRPAIFMPAVASRLTLTVTAIRVERLHDISEADAMAEGANQTDGGWWTHDRSDPITGNDPVESFRRLWEHINGPDSWAANPWVWVVSFKRLEGTHA